MKDKHYMLVIDEAQSQVVRDICDWYLKGLTIGGIVKRLKSKGIKLPKVKTVGVKEQLSQP